MLYVFYLVQDLTVFSKTVLSVPQSRLVYNKALHERTQAWYERQERVGYAETSSMLTDWKKQEELEFLNEVSCVPLQQGLRHLQTAFTSDHRYRLQKGYSYWIMQVKRRLA